MLTSPSVIILIFFIALVSGTASIHAMATLARMVRRKAGGDMNRAARNALQ